MSEQNDELVRLKSAIAASGDVVYDWDLVTNKITWSGPAGRLFGTAWSDPPTGDAFLRRIVEDDLPKRSVALSIHCATREAFDCEYRVRGQGDRHVWVHERGAVRLSPQGHPTRMAGTLRNITSRKGKEHRLEYLANYDDLTGHYNRGRLKHALEHALTFSSRYRVPGAYLLIGIDHLSEVNATHGYQAADAVIIGVGQRLDRCLRAADVIGRIGGDCFGVVLGNCPETDLSAAAEKLLRSVREAAIDTPAGPIRVTISIGGVAFLDHGPIVHDAMAQAETALREAKAAGRDRFAQFSVSEEQREQRRRTVAMAEEVQLAVKEDRLLFAFQPIVDAQEHKVDHYECLLRLRRRDGSLIVAGEFVPVVEQCGLMRLIDRRALELAIDELTRYPNVRLAINISGHTASDRSWLRALNAMVRPRPEFAKRLIIEITETVALQDIDETARFVAAIRDLGCSVALDDFGAGYTSFRTLKALTVDCVKIDGSYVKGLSENVDNQLFIRTLLGLAQGFGLATVAECVETAADAQHLTRRGVRFLQGHYFGRPTTERPWLSTAPAHAFDDLDSTLLVPEASGA
ncbi:MAG: GGDEF and EAL domain-containing protein [Proteobacteria bacterium]|nr:GGDEF and EAL domain-containing protein [Pseudomonadota bacterium]